MQHLQCSESVTCLSFHSNLCLYFKMNYRYFDTPDGHDCVLKFIYTTKIGLKAGIGLSSFYVILVDTPKTYGQFFARYAKITLPCLATAALGTMTVCSLVTARDKDDEFNHFCGGLVGGIAGGVAKGHIGQGISAGIIFGILAAAYKHCKLNNYNVIEPVPMRFSTDDHWSVNYEWRFGKDRPKDKDWIAK